MERTYNFSSPFRLLKPHPYLSPVSAQAAARPSGVERARSLARTTESNYPATQEAVLPPSRIGFDYRVETDVNVLP